MKKIFALILAIVMTVAISVPVFAEDTSFSSDDTGVVTPTTKIEYGVDQTYTITIPASVTINRSTRQGEAKITVSDVCIPAGTNIKVSVTSSVEPTSPNKWELQDAATTGSKAANVGYTVKVDGSEIERGATFLTAASAVTFTATSKTLAIEVNKTMQVANYEDYLTFSVAIAA